uniref:Uncharacterized protein n=1 Tax=Timema shepardi TaxID=629360 RepID=A0A7R9FX80_TIMSH|nr:unnamed protein product [Timema shepardi]
MSFSRCTWVILVPNLVAIVLICGTLLYYWAEPPVKHVATLRRNRERTFVTVKITYLKFCFQLSVTSAREDEKIQLRTKREGKSDWTRFA